MNINGGTLFGFLLIDKPAGLGSGQIVLQVAKRLRDMGFEVPVGHCGTLDPLATGLMVLAIGPATRLTPWLQSGNKRYEARFQLGVTSESLDLETPLVEADPVPHPLLETVRATCANFVGRRSQIPPKYSAIHVQGKRAYELARDGRQFELPPREIRIHRLDLLEYAWPSFKIDVLCSGGTYIRTLGDDLAREWGTRAVMTDLRRTAASGYELQQAWSWSEINSTDTWTNQLLSVASALHDLPRVTVDLEIARRFRNGLVSQTLDAQLEETWRVHGHEVGTAKSSKEILVLLPDQRPVGIVYHRSKAGCEDAWRIKLNLAQWLEPDFF